jgi:Cu/Ag efflux protein CusF
MQRRRLLSLLAAPLALTVALRAPAQPPGAAESTGEVTRVDRAGARVGIRHGEIPALDLPPMTMNYRVRDAAMLEGVSPGDRVRFTVERGPGGLVVTRLTRL